MTAIFSVTADETNEIDFIIYLRNDGSQAVVDELILKAESLGLTVNPIYLDWVAWMDAALYTSDWDLAYGGLSIGYPVDNIFNLAYDMAGLNFFKLRHDDAILNKFALDLWMMLNTAQNDPAVDIVDLMTDMIDKFHDAEERIWEKQYIFTFSFKTI